MKTTKHIIITAIAAMAVTLLAFTGVQKQKLKVELTIPEWESVLQVIDQSNAPHQQVQAVQKVILSQLQEQLQADSTNQNQ